MKNAILQYLKINGQVKRKRLLTYLRNTGFEHATTRDISFALNELEEIDGHIILSGGNGIKLAETIKEYEQAVAFSRSYALAYIQKTRVRKRNFLRMTASLVVNSDNQLTQQ